MTTRRDLLKLAGAGALGLAARKSFGTSASSGWSGEPAAKPPRPLRILILGGTGFTGPHQVGYALARGHKLTLFNRGRRPQQWPAPVEELVGDRNTGESQRASTPSVTRWSRRAIRPGRSPTPSAFESWNERG